MLIRRHGQDVTDEASRTGLTGQKSRTKSFFCSFSCFSFLVSEVSSYPELCYHTSQHALSDVNTVVVGHKYEAILNELRAATSGTETLLSNQEKAPQIYDNEAKAEAF